MCTECRDFSCFWVNKAIGYELSDEHSSSRNDDCFLDSGTRLPCVQVVERDASVVVPSLLALFEQNAQRVFSWVKVGNLAAVAFSFLFGK